MRESQGYEDQFAHVSVCVQINVDAHSGGWAARRLGRDAGFVDTGSSAKERLVVGSLEKN